jgi:hypothetical protein
VKQTTYDDQSGGADVSDAREEELHRLAEVKGLAVSVTHSTGGGKNLVEIWVGDPAQDGRDARTFWTFEHARRYLNGEE